LLVAAALIRLNAVRDSGPWDGAWRLGGYPILHFDVQALHEETASVKVTGTVAHALVSIDDLEFETRASIAGDVLTLTANGVTSQVRFAQGDALWLHSIRFGNWAVKTSLLRDRALRTGGGSGHGVGPWIARSPMPGAVANVPVVVGQEVAAGEAVVAVEAMKMEHTLRSPGRGIVTEIRVAVGQQVKLDEDLVIVDLIKENE
jgi:acetyl-CoA/propionyl-CoA carboxylase biotin carboxyl carrier protein